MTAWRDMSRAKSNWPMGGQHLSHCPIGTPEFPRDRSREGHVIVYSRSRDVNFFHWQQCAKPCMRGLRVTARYCAGQTRMYTFLYPNMGIVSRDNVHNVKITARVRRACIYIHIWVSCHLTMYSMIRLLRGSDVHTHILMSIYGYHVYSRDNVHNVRVTARVIYSTCIRQKMSYPYMGTV